jgi:hypothetical protein
LGRGQSERVEPESFQFQPFNLQLEPVLAEIRLAKNKILPMNLAVKPASPSLQPAGSGSNA